MPNRPIPIELDKLRHLYFDFNALVVVGDNVNVPVQDLLSNLRRGLDFKTLRALLLGGLAHEDDTLTAKSVGIMLDPFLKRPAELAKISAALGQALMAAFMDETGEGEAEKKDAGQVPTAMIPKSRGRGKLS